MEEKIVDCNVNFRVDGKQIESFTIGFSYLPRIGEVFIYESSVMEVVSIMHHQIIENGRTITVGADATLYVKEIGTQSEWTTRII